MTDFLPPWFLALLDLRPEDLARPTLDLGAHSYHIRDGLLRRTGIADADQAQSAQAFAYKWGRRDTYEGENMRDHMAAWLTARYGPAETALGLERHTGQAPLTLLDAGCGSGYSALAYLAPVRQRLRYIGVDVSESVDTARDRFRDAGWTDGALLQADLCDLPFKPASLDVIFSEGVLHHTPSTQGALSALAPLLKPGGRFLFYVYRRKGPVREFTDDHIRQQLRDRDPADAWRALEPLSRLGQVLGDLDITIDIPEDIDLLEIPAGPISLQRLFYWHIFKCFYRPDMTLDEMTMVNFDWYTPAYAHRQSMEEVLAYCQAADLTIETAREEEAGITIIATRTGA